MLDPFTWSKVPWSSVQRPLLVVIVDTEAEFVWRSKAPRKAVGVSSAKKLELTQRIFDKFDCRPTYVLDFPVSSRDESFRPVRELVASGRCEIGAHLQPWDNPPMVEALDEFNSYPGNLPPELERAKLVLLTDTIEGNVGRRPRIYKAGRYGVGPATEMILAELGYEIDASVVPGTDLRRFLGPDFRRCGVEPYWFGRYGRLLELPLTVGFTGLFARSGVAIYQFASALRMTRLRVPGILAHLGLLDRITLTPEGVELPDLCRLTKALLRTGQRIFSFTYHSSSLVAGNTPYVRTSADLEGFLERIESYLEFFMGEIGGAAATPFEVRALAARLSDQHCGSGLMSASALQNAQSAE